MNVKGIVKGTLLSIILVAIALFIGAVLVYFNIITEKSASITMFASAMIGIFIGAYGVVKTSDSRLLINAMSVALLFSLVIFIISIIANGGIEFHTRTLTLIGGAFAAAFLGTLFGK